MAVDNEGNQLRFLSTLRGLSSVAPGATIKQLEVLMYISARPRCTASEISIHTDQTPANVSRSLDYWGSGGKLVGKGFIIRHDIPGDRRTKALTLNSKGKKFVTKLMGAIVRATPEEIRRLAKDQW